MSKSRFVPGIRVEPEREAAYVEAFERWAAQQPADVRLSDWIRQALDVAAGYRGGRLKRPPRVAG
jgi:hypothetical protein